MHIFIAIFFAATSIWQFYSAKLNSDSAQQGLNDTSIHQSPKSSLIQLNSLINNLKGSLPPFKFLHLYYFILHFLIVLEESMNLLQNMLGKLTEVIVMRNGHIALGNSDDLIILLTLIDHSHHSDDLSLEQAEWLNSDRAENENIQGIVILAIGLRDETVVCWVMNCAEEDSVESQESTILIELVFDLTFCGDLNDGVDDLWAVFSERNVVPWIFSEVLLGLLDHPTTIKNQILIYISFLLISNRFYPSRTNWIRCWGEQR